MQNTNVGVSRDHNITRHCDLWRCAGRPFSYPTRCNL